MAPESFSSLARDRQEVIRIFSGEISVAQLRLEDDEITASGDISREHLSFRNIACGILFGFFFPSLVPVVRACSPLSSFYLVSPFSCFVKWRTRFQRERGKITKMVKG